VKAFGIVNSFSGPSDCQQLKKSLNQHFAIAGLAHRQYSPLGEHLEG
jgi:hypothetical protein